MSKIGLIAAALAAGLLSAAPAVMAQGVAATPPAAQSFTLGALRMTSLRDGGFKAPNDGKTFGLNTTPAEVAKVLANAGAPTDSIALSVNVLLVRMPGHLVLLDTGLGPRFPGALPKSLALVGVSPDQITDVLITHSHGDHVGGLLDASGKPAFPKAVIRMSAKEWAAMQASAPAKAMVAAIAPQVRPFEPGRPILPGVTPFALPGHTVGHTGYVIVSQGHTLEDIGDIAHSSIVSLARPDWTIKFDGDQTLGAATRRAELTRLAMSQVLVFAPHFPFPGVGHIKAVGDGYRWEPEAFAAR